MSVKRGIYLVANRNSEWFCENLIHSIRESGCLLPIRLIHFGGERIRSSFIINNTELLDANHFPAEAIKFINDLESVLVECPRGFLYRFLAWFGDWDEFIYSDNDIVALCNWDILFDHLVGYDLVHSDEEYTTKGRYNYLNPNAIEEMFGQGALLTAMTAGHFAVRRKEQAITDMQSAIEWFRKYPEIPKKHDQSLMHVASLIGSWKMMNLCKLPNNWLTTWAGDYKNTLAVVHAMHNKGYPRSISHLHYSGGRPDGTLSIDDFLFASKSTSSRLRSIIYNGIMLLSGVTGLLRKKRRLMRRLKVFLKSR